MSPVLFIWKFCHFGSNFIFRIRLRLLLHFSNILRSQQWDSISNSFRLNFYEFYSIHFIFCDTCTLWEIHTTNSSINHIRGATLTLCDLESMSPNSICVNLKESNYDSASFLPLLNVYFEIKRIPNTEIRGLSEFNLPENWPMMSRTKIWYVIEYG